MSHKKKHKQTVGSSVELNVMPFIDIFSLLCTFLLFSAVFVSMGIVDVQVPFLSNAKPNFGDSKHERTLSINIEINLETISLSTEWSEEPINKKSWQFKRDKSGISKFHNFLIKIKDKFNKQDKVTLFTDDKLSFEEVIEIIDAIKLRNIDKASASKGVNSPLFTKVVMGSVLL